jgi:hypothetical protein
MGYRYDRSIVQDLRLLYDAPIFGWLSPMVLIVGSSSVLFSSVPRHPSTLDGHYWTRSLEESSYFYRRHGGGLQEPDS